MWEQPQVATPPEDRTSRTSRLSWAGRVTALAVLVLGLVVACSNLFGAARAQSAMPAPAVVVPGAPEGSAGAPSTGTASGAPTAGTETRTSQRGTSGTQAEATTKHFTTVAESDFDGSRVGDDVHRYADVPGRYAWSNTSVEGGHLVMHVTGKVGAGLWLGEPITYGRVTARVKVTGADGNGAAILLWPVSDDPGEGEIDFAEGDFDKPIHVFHHMLGKAHREHVSTKTDVDWREWHDVSVEWTPHEVRYLIDGEVVQTNTENIPSTRFRLTMQLDNTEDHADPGALLVDSYRIEKMR